MNIENTHMDKIISLMIEFRNAKDAESLRNLKLLIYEEVLKSYNGTDKDFALKTINAMNENIDNYIYAFENNQVSTSIIKYLNSSFASLKALASIHI